VKGSHTISSGDSRIFSRRETNGNFPTIFVIKYSFLDKLKFFSTLFKQTFSGSAKMANQISNEKKLFLIYKSKKSPPEAALVIH